MKQTLFCLLLLFVVGCQTPYRAEHGRESQGFLAKTMELLAPDGDEPSSPERPHQQAIPQRTAPSQAVVCDPSAYYVAGNGTGTTHFGAMRPYGLFSDMSFGMPNTMPEGAEVAEQYAAEPEVEANILQAKSGDSEALRRFLKELETIPPEDWKIDRDEFNLRLANFRSSMKGEKNPELEAQYLMHLRKGIVPDSRLMADKKRAKPRDAVEESRPARLYRPQDPEADEKGYVSVPKKHSDELAYDDTEEFDEEGFDAEMPRRPLAVKRTKAAPLPQQEELARSEPKVEAAKPKYGRLTQLDNSHVVQASYKEQHDAGVVTADYAKQTQPEGDNWESAARTAADMLRRKIEQTPDARNFSNESKLRLLELVLGNRSEAVRPFSPGVQAEKPLNDFWSNLILGLSALQDEVAVPDRQARFVNAAFRFDEGLMSFRRLCPMKLKNVQLVKDWVTFGVFLPHNEDCRAGEELGLYLELDNPTVRQGSQGHNVRASISYEIRDNAANIIQKSDKIPVEETTPSQKRDYCIHLVIRLPNSLSHGQYQLRVNVTDMNSESLQYAEEQIPLKVIPTKMMAGD